MTCSFTSRHISWRITCRPAGTGRRSLVWNLNKRRCSRSRTSRNVSAAAPVVVPDNPDNSGPIAEAPPPPPPPVVAPPPPPPPPEPAPESAIAVAERAIAESRRLADARSWKSARVPLDRVLAEPAVASSPIASSSSGARSRKPERREREETTQHETSEVPSSRPRGPLAPDATRPGEEARDAPQAGDRAERGGHARARARAGARPRGRPRGARSTLDTADAKTTRAEIDAREAWLDKLGDSLPRPPARPRSRSSRAASASRWSAPGRRGSRSSRDRQDSAPWHQAPARRGARAHFRGCREKDAPRARDGRRARPLRPGALDAAPTCASARGSRPSPRRAARVRPGRARPAASPRSRRPRGSSVKNEWLTPRGGRREDSATPLVDLDGKADPERRRAKARRAEEARQYAHRRRAQDDERERRPSATSSGRNTGITDIKTIPGLRRPVEAQRTLSLVADGFTHDELGRLRARIADDRRAARSSPIVERSSRNYSRYVNVHRITVEPGEERDQARASAGSTCTSPRGTRSSATVRRRGPTASSRPSATSSW